MSNAAAASRAGTSEDAPRTARVYFPELDGLRFVAFAFVYLFHGGVPLPLLIPILGKPLAQALRSNGWLGVQLFFVLSGYLITTLLLREEARFGRIDLRAFWVRRVLRIWPLYYLILAIGFVVIPYVDHDFGTTEHRALVADHLAPFLVFLGNWSMSLIGPIPSESLGVLWSVCVEEQFYVVVPLVVASVGRRYRIGLVMVAIAGAVLARWLVARSYPVELVIRFNTFLCFDTLLSGVLLALLAGTGPGSARSERWAGWLQWPVLLCGVWLFSRDQLGAGSTWRRTWDFVWIWAWGVALIAVLVHSRGWLHRALAYSRLAWLGKISYGLYMFHEVALWIKWQVGLRVDWFPNRSALFTIAAFALTVGMAACSYYLYERPFLTLKRRWTRVASRPL